VGGWVLPVLGRRGLREASSSRSGQTGGRCDRATRPSLRPLAGMPLSLAGSSRHARSAGSRRRKPPPGLRRARRWATRAATAARDHHRSSRGAASGNVRFLPSRDGVRPRRRRCSGGEDARRVRPAGRPDRLGLPGRAEARLAGRPVCRHAVQVGARRALPVAARSAGLPSPPGEAAAETDRRQSTVESSTATCRGRLVPEGSPYGRPTRASLGVEGPPRAALLASPDERARWQNGSVRTTSGVRRTCSTSAAVFGRLVVAVESACPKRPPRR